jgi:hypothetical protein
MAENEPLEDPPLNKRGKKPPGPGPFQIISVSENVATALSAAGRERESDLHGFAAVCVMNVSTGETWISLISRTAKGISTPEFTPMTFQWHEPAK